MAKQPFTLRTPVPELARNSGGRFVRMPTPQQFIDRGAAAQGITNGQALRAQQVPDHPVGPGVKDTRSPGSPAPAPVYEPAMPWPAPGPINDANKKPFRLKG